MAPRLLTYVVTVAALLGVAAPAAVAQQDSPTVDPSSPSGKEYALPLQAARQDGGGDDHAAPTAKSGSDAQENAPLFGVGVSEKTATTAATATAASTATRHAAAKHHAGRPTTTGRTTTTTTTSGAKTQTTALAAATPGGGDGGGGGTLAVIVVGVLAVGLLAGAALRWQLGRTAGAGAPRRG